MALLIYAVILSCWLTGALGLGAPALQAAYLIVVCLLLPMLYYWTTRSAVASRVAMLRSVGLAISAITLSGWLVVDREASGFWTFVVIQSVGAAVIVVIEIRIMILLMSKAFRAEPDREGISRESGLPQFVVDLMIREARFWRMVYRAVMRMAFMGRR